MSQSETADNRAMAALWLWLAVSAGPLFQYTFPLFHQSLTNSPTAYLIWIPVLGFAWAGWNLHRMRGMGRVNVADHSLWWALFLCLATATVLFASQRGWMGWADTWYIGLLLWPLWSLGTVWLIYGFAPTRFVIKPLVYLFLVWPPLYLKLIAIVNPALAYATTTLVRQFAGWTSWVKAGASSDLFAVQTGAKWFTIQVSQACSGSDSVLAILVLFPVALVLFRGTFVQKCTLVIIGCVLAFLFNVIRIGLIITGLHVLGYHFAFDVLHPLLGAVFFFAVIVGLLFWGAKSTVVSRTGHGPVPPHSRLRMGLAVLISGVVAGGLWTRY